MKRRNAPIPETMGFTFCGISSPSNTNETGPTPNVNDKLNNRKVSIGQVIK